MNVTLEGKDHHTGYPETDIITIGKVHPTGSQKPDITSIGIGRERGGGLGRDTEEGVVDPDPDLLLLPGRLYREETTLGPLGSIG